MDQPAFIYDLFEEENLTDCKAVNIPIKTRNFIKMLEDNNYKDPNIKTYQHFIGKLMYLSSGTRPNIVFDIRQLSKRNADPRVGHLKAAKRVLKYFKETIHLEITYEAGEVKLLPYKLTGYADSNQTGDLEDHKSVMGYCFFINGAIVSQYSKKQQIVSTSTTEVEYITLEHIV